jgi:hypothetical protein
MSTSNPMIRRNSQVSLMLTNGALVFVRDLVMITARMHQPSTSQIHPPKGGAIKNTSLTVSCFGLHDDVTLHHQTLQSGPLGGIELAKGKVTDSGRPKALERFRVLAPRVNEDVEAGAVLYRRILQERKDRVRLIVDQEREGNDEALQDRPQVNLSTHVEQRNNTLHLKEGGSLGSQHSSNHRLQQLWQDWQHGLASPPQKVDYEVSNSEATRLVLVLQQFSDQVQHAV